MFYITPIDMETGTRHLPEDFPAVVKQNCRLIEQRLRERGGEVIDLSHSLGPGAFSWNEYPNEHLRQNGRCYVAKRLAQTLLSPRSGVPDTVNTGTGRRLLCHARDSEWTTLCQD